MNLWTHEEFFFTLVVFVHNLTPPLPPQKKNSIESILTSSNNFFGFMIYAGKSFAVHRLQP